MGIVYIKREIYVPRKFPLSKLGEYVLNLDSVDISTKSESIGVEGEFYMDIFEISNMVRPPPPSLSMVSLKRDKSKEMLIERLYPVFYNCLYPYHGKSNGYFGLQQALDKAQKLYNGDGEFLLVTNPTDGKDTCVLITNRAIKRGIGLEDALEKLDENFEIILRREG